MIKFCSLYVRAGRTKRIQFEVSENVKTNKVKYLNQKQMQ